MQPFNTEHWKDNNSLFLSDVLSWEAVANAHQLKSGYRLRRVIKCAESCQLSQTYCVSVTQYGSWPAEGTRKLNTVLNRHDYITTVRGSTYHNFLIPGISLVKKTSPLCNPLHFREEMEVCVPSCWLTACVQYLIVRSLFGVAVNNTWLPSDGASPLQQKMYWICPIWNFPPSYQNICSSSLTSTGTWWKLSVMTPNPPHKASGGASSSAYGSEVGGGWTQGGCRLHIVPWGQIKAYSSPY